MKRNLEDREGFSCSRQEKRNRRKSVQMKKTEEESTTLLDIKNSEEDDWVKFTNVQEELRLALDSETFFAAPTPLMRLRHAVLLLQRMYGTQAIDKDTFAKGTMMMFKSGDGKIIRWMTAMSALDEANRAMFVVNSVGAFYE